MWRLSLFLVLGAACAPAWAVTTCSGGNVSLGFGAYDYFQAGPSDVQIPFVVTCTRVGGPPSTSVTVALGPSIISGTIANRQMTGGIDRLDYNIYRDATRLSVWGNTTGTDTMSQTVTLANGASGSLTFTLFGRLPAAQDVRAGIYTDSVLVTVTF